MPSINISKTYQCEREALNTIVEDVRNKLAERYQVESEWQNDSQVTFSKQNVTGEILIDAQTVHVNIELPMLMGAFKGQIEKQIHAVLERKLA